jgi:hypothetical protein
VEFRLKRYFLSRIIFNFFEGKHPKFSVFTPCFRLYGRTGMRRFNSGLWVLLYLATISCAFVSSTGRFSIPHIFSHWQAATLSGPPSPMRLFAGNGANAPMDGKHSDPKA